MNKLKKIIGKTKINPKVELKEDKLYLYGPISERQPIDWWTGEPIPGDYITVDVVKEALNELKGDKLTIHLNSKGGDVYTSIAIGNLLKDSDKEITVIVDAIAASGASIIAMAGDKVKMYPNSLMMIHRASTYVYGNAEELREVASSLDKFDEAVLASYKNHYKGSQEELQELIENETYLTADDCLECGFADEILEEVKDNENESKQNRETGKVVAETKPEIDLEELSEVFFKVLNSNNLKVVANEQKEEQQSKEKRNLLSKFKEDK